MSAQDKVMNYITKTEAFAHHGATLTAPRGIRAKKSDDGQFVVLAAWRKGFNRDPFLPGKASYTFGDGSANSTPNRICYFSPNICSALPELATHPQRPYARRASGDGSRRSGGHQPRPKRKSVSPGCPCGSASATPIAGLP